ncbi:hypothetical protein SPAR130_0527 [Streptococcus pneumoniae 5652-06]|nr:hypothetical protein SPAR130_0527 [Streptococcus pneumoniae 5652-06]
MQNLIDFTLDFHAHTICTEMICHDIPFSTLNQKLGQQT